MHVHDSQSETDVHLFKVAWILIKFLAHAEEKLIKWLICVGIKG